MKLSICMSLIVIGLCSMPANAFSPGGIPPEPFVKAIKARGYECAGTPAVITVMQEHSQRSPSSFSVYCAQRPGCTLADLYRVERHGSRLSVRRFTDPRTGKLVTPVCG
jgi:hypothetical protein